eukprot:g66519.t1
MIRARPYPSDPRARSGRNHVEVWILSYSGSSASLSCSGSSASSAYVRLDELQRWLKCESLNDTCTTPHARGICASLLLTILTSTRALAARSWREL